ncbi:uridine kinase [Prosthecochloris sp. N3]|uniref:Uridine kinase n=1 Tax=Prosthecochloris ethylica TaxID=2743976 RepID=A0ABR9XPJ0_9CHLB|nr:uridine kinase [Prosthecochloris ethylica]MBF0585816.1 uridine kinase [Prosthecochloris ethylica]MBF0635726.1 uridine kinase [Prosthecochloris ethylica]NUK47024.1 uridine kinase [Prosthecochloris ethylica]
MLNDILLIGEKHKKAAEAIAERVLIEKQAKEEEETGYRFIVAISGESGAGKSELSHSLAMVLKRQGIRVKILHTDNYYRVEPLNRRAARDLNNFENIGPEEYNRELLEQNIEEFRRGAIADMPCIDIITEKVDRLTTDFSDIELLIIDGLYAISTEGIDLGIYIDLTYRETKKNQFARGKETTDDHRWKVLEQEHQSARKLRRLANTFVDRDYKVLFRD